MKLGRIKDMKTALRYMKARQQRLIETVAAVAHAARGGGGSKISVVHQ